jgi:hypothetical protein
MSNYTIPNIPAPEVWGDRHMNNDLNYTRMLEYYNSLPEDNLLDQQDETEDPTNVPVSFSLMYS